MSGKSPELAEGDELVEVRDIELEEFAAICEEEERRSPTESGMTAWEESGMLDEEVLAGLSTWLLLEEDVSAGSSALTLLVSSLQATSVIATAANAPNKPKRFIFLSLLVMNIIDISQKKVVDIL